MGVTCPLRTDPRSSEREDPKGGSEMSRKRFTPEQIIGMPREAEVALSALVRTLSRSQKISLPVSYL
jgi:hypothetical protein